VTRDHAQARGREILSPTSMKLACCVSCLIAGCSFEQGTVALDGHVMGSDSSAPLCFGTDGFAFCLTTVPIDMVTLVNSKIDTDVCTGQGTQFVDIAGVSACAIAATTITLPQGIVVSAIGSKPFVLAATGSMDVAGSLSVASSVSGTIGAGADPLTCSMTGIAGSTAIDCGGGGAGGSFGGIGGDGGECDTSTAATAAGSAAPAVTAPISTLRGGCAGGSGGGGNAGLGTGGVAGNGGGAVYVATRGALAISGTIDASGAGGGGVVTANKAAGGGGGAGGMIVVLSAPLDANGAVLIADGGGGGGGADMSNMGGSGSDPTMVAPITSASGGSGGGGAGGSGGDGADSASPAGAGSASPGPGGGGGGGGGGLGVLRVFGDQDLGNATTSPSPS
jgi:hypothetical protein